MTKVKIQLPKLGEGVIEATITRWLIELNGRIEEDEPLVEIATDKVDTEIPSPVTGILLKTFYDEGEIPKIGDTIAIIESDKNELSDEDYLAQETIPSTEEQTPEEKISSEAVFVESVNKTMNQPITPFIRHYASQRGIGIQELQRINGSGDNGSITKTDILNYFKAEKIINGIQPDNFNIANNTSSKDNIVKYEAKEGEEVIELDRVRQLIADNMVNSVHTAPHVTSTVEIDVSKIVQWRDNVKEKFMNDNGVKLTYTPVFVQKVVHALRDFPGINVSLYGNKLIKKSEINIGIATALPNGNLVVPVVHNADRKNLSKLALDIYDQTIRARKGGLNPSETQGGTFTITNLGQVNNIFGTPIINQPESAILAIGAIKKRPWVVESHGVQSIGIRDVVTLSLSYDHRIIDGSLGGAFLNRIGELLEESLPEL